MPEENPENPPQEDPGPQGPQGPGMPFITLEGPNGTERHRFINFGHAKEIRGERHPDHMNDPDFRNVTILWADNTETTFFGKAG